MSGIEVLGAAAAASQLFGYILDIAEALFELRDHIKHAPARLQSYVEQLESLAATIQYIQENQNLLNPVVETPIKAISQKVNSLNQLLRKSLSKVSQPPLKRYIRIFVEKKIERRIKEGFAALEGDKVNLVLCMAGLNRRALEEFRVDLFIRTGKTVRRDSLSSLSDLSDSTLDKEKQSVPRLMTGEKQPGMTSTNSSTSTPDTLDSGETNEPTEARSDCQFVGNEASNNVIGSIGVGVSRGDFQNNKAMGNSVGLIGPMDANGLKVLLELKLPSPPSGARK